MHKNSVQMSVKERIIEYTKFKEISTREFCRIIGVSETYVNSMRNSIQPDKLVRIVHAFPDLNTEWLLTGEGEMIKGNTTLPPIERDQLVSASSEVFKDKLIEMFKNGEIFSASIVWEQHRIIVNLGNKINEQLKEIERLKYLLKLHGIESE